MVVPALSLRHVSLRYEHGVCALDDVSLDVAEGERVCVLGANGSGKSTLASVLTGLLAPDEGDVELVGEHVCRGGVVDFDAYRRARRRLGLVFQNPDDQIVTSVVEEDVAFGPENLCVPSDQIDVRVRRELARVALTRLAQADPAHLSGGQKQRVAIASAMAMEPAVLVLDEPGALLDVRGRRGIMRVMAELAQAGTTIVHVTHFMEEALAADRVLVMQAGRIVIEGTPAQVFARADELLGMGLELPFTAQLAQQLRLRGLAVPFTCDSAELLRALDTSGGVGLPAMPRDASRAGVSQQEPPREEDLCSPWDAASHEVPATETEWQRRVQAQGGPAIQMSHVSYSYGAADAREDQRPALDDLSLSVAPASMVALVGQTGSGKSTCLRLVCALEVPDSGIVTIGGIETRTRRARRQLHGRIGYVMQHPERQLFAETVWDDVAYGPRNLRLSDAEVRRRCAHALELVGLTGREDVSPFHLSGGQQRLCALAGVLAMEPHTLVLDEPTSGLDPWGRKQLRSILADVQAGGVAVVQVTHSMEDAARCERIYVLSEGRLIVQGSPVEVFSPDHAQLLHDVGLGLPQSLQWAQVLRDVGWGQIGRPLTLDALVAGIVTGARGRC